MECQCLCVQVSISIIQRRLQNDPHGGFGGISQINRNQDILMKVMYAEYEVPVPKILNTIFDIADHWIQMIFESWTKGKLFK